MTSINTTYYFRSTTFLAKDQLPITVSLLNKIPNSNPSNPKHQHISNLPTSTYLNVRDEIRFFVTA
jgi:hypothetical protein